MYNVKIHGSRSLAKQHLAQPTFRRRPNSAGHDVPVAIVVPAVRIPSRAADRDALAARVSYDPRLEHCGLNRRFPRSFAIMLVCMANAEMNCPWRVQSPEGSEAAMIYRLHGDETDRPWGDCQGPFRYFG